MLLVMPGRQPERSPDLRILYVCYEFPVLTQTFTVAEVEGLREAGLTVEVISCRQPRDQGTTGTTAPVRVLPRPFSMAALGASLGFAIRRPLRTSNLVLTIATARYRDQSFRCRLRGFTQFIWGAWLAREIAREPTLPHLHAQFIDAASTVAFIAARLTGATFSVTNHTAYNPYLPGPKLDHAAAFFSISRYDRRHLLDLAGREDVPTLQVLYQGIDTASFAGEREVRDGGPTRILTVSALKEKKGQDVLLKALARVVEGDVDVRLTVVGDGPLLPDLEALAERLGVRNRVEFAGSERPSSVSARLRRADIFVLACRQAENGDLDGIPISLMEAMAAGVPVISTRLSGIPELIEDGEEGRLAEPGDPDSLAAALQAAIADPAGARKMAARALEKVQRQHERSVQVGAFARALLEIGEGGGDHP